MKSSIRIVALTTVLAMTSSLPNVYYPQQYPSHKQEQQWSRNQPSYVHGGRPYTPDWSDKTQNQRQGYSPEQNYLPQSYQEDGYSNSHSASPMYPKVKTIEIRSGPGPREFKLPLNGDPKRIEIHHLNAETYTTDEPSSPDSYSVMEGQKSIAAVKSMELIHHYSDSDGESHIFDIHSKELDSEPETKDVKIRLVSEDKLRPEEVNSNKGKVIRLNTTEYSESDIPKSLPPAVREVLKKALASLRKSQGTGQNNIDESRPEIEIAKSSSELIQPVPRNNNASRPLYRPSRKYRKPIVFPTSYEPTQSYQTLNVPNRSFTQAPITETSTSQDSNVAISEISSSTVKTQPTPAKRNSSGSRKNYYMVPIIPNRNSQTYAYSARDSWRPKYRPHSKNIKKSIDDNKHYDPPIPADEILSANEYKETSKPTKVFRNELKSQQMFSSDTDKSSLSDFTEPSFILEPLSTTDKYDSSSTLITDDWKHSSSPPSSDVNKPVEYVRHSNTMNPADKALPEDELDFKSDDISPNYEEASIKEAEKQAILLSVTDKSDYTPLTLEPLSTTDNYDSSSTIIPDQQNSSSSTSISDENKPVEYDKRSALILGNKTLPENESKSVSEGLTPTPTEANREDIKSKAILAINTGKSLSNDSNPKPLLLASENTDSSHLKSVNISSSHAENSIKIEDTQAIPMSENEESDYDIFTEASLTVEPLSTTDNYDSSLIIIPDNRKNSSSSPASDGNKPGDYVRRSNPKISDDKTLCNDDSESISEDLTPNPEEAYKENIKSIAILPNDTGKNVSVDKNVSNDSDPKLLAKENSDSSIPPNEDWTYKPSAIKRIKSGIPASSDVTLSTSKADPKPIEADPPQNSIDSSTKIMSNQEISMTENNDNTPKYHPNDLSNMNTTDLKQRVIYEESIQEGNGTDNTKEQNNAYILEDTKNSSDDKVVGKSKLDATVYFKAISEKQDTDSLTEMNDASMDQEYLSKVNFNQSEEDMNPISFVVNLIINFCKGGDSVIKMFRDSKVQDFVSKHTPIINIQLS